jgi:hypothetical protein
MLWSIPPVNTVRHQTCFLSETILWPKILFPVTVLSSYSVCSCQATPY